MQQNSTSPRHNSPLKRVLFALACLAFFPSVALASPATQYVTQGCANNGDGTAASCAASGGAAGAFNTFANWESQDLTLTQHLTVNFSGTFTAGGTLSGWTVGANRIILDGLIITGSTYGAELTISVDNVTIQDANISKSGSGKTRPLMTIGTQAGIIIQRSQFWVNLTTLDGGTWMWQKACGGSGATIIRNNIFYGADQTAVTLCFESGETLTVENNTIADNGGTGLEISANSSSGSTVNLYNNISVGNGVDYDVGTGTATYNHATNIDSDTTGPETTATITFVGAPDYHLDAGETDAIDAGTDLSGSFTDDIDGDTRDASFDIGADEVAGSPPTTTTTTTTTSTTTTTTVTTRTNTTLGGANYTDIPGDTYDEDNSGSDAAGPTNDTDMDGYTEDGSLLGTDCDDTDRRMIAGTYTTTGCTAGEVKQCQSDGTFTACGTYGNGTIYWVDPVSGSDSNDGLSRADSFQHLDCVSYYSSGAPACNVSLACGDTVIALAGTHTSSHATNAAINTNWQWVVYNKSCSGNPIRFIAEGAAVFTPSGTSTSTGVIPIGIMNSTGVYVDLGLSGEITGFHVGSTGGVEAGAIRMDGSNEIEVRDAYIHDVTGYSSSNNALIYAGGGSYDLDIHHNILADILDDGTGNNPANLCLFVSFSPPGTLNEFHHNVAVYTNNATVLCGIKATKHGASGAEFEVDHNLISRASIISAQFLRAHNNMIADSSEQNTCGIDESASNPAIGACDLGGTSYPGGVMQYNTIVNSKCYAWIPNNSYTPFTYNTWTVSNNICVDNSGSYGSTAAFANIAPYGSDAAYTEIITGGGYLSEANGCYYTSTSGGLKWSVFGNNSSTSLGDLDGLTAYQNRGYCAGCTNTNPTLDSTLAPTAVCTSSYGFYAGESTPTTTTTTTTTSTTTTTEAPTPPPPSTGETTGGGGGIICNILNLCRGGK